MHLSITSSSVFIFVVYSAAACQAANPVLSKVVPAGAQRGATAEVTLYGSNLSDAVDLLFHEPGISLVTFSVSSSDSVRAILDLSADCPLGSHALRVRTRGDLSNLRLFSVGSLPEIEEIEPNSDRAAAQSIPMQTTVNAIVTSEDIDFFAVQLNRGDRLAVEAEALRLGITLFDIKLRLFGPGGHELIAEDDTAVFRQDSAFVHIAEETGTYAIAVSEAAYGGSGDCHYRLHVGSFPRPLAVTPMGGVAGGAVEVTWLGDQGIGSQIAKIPETSEPSVFTVFPESSHGISPNGLKFRTSDLPSYFEAEPNNDQIQASTVTVPGALEGVLSEPGDSDWFGFEGKNGQAFDVQVWGRRLGSPIDSVIDLIQPSGNALASDDDSAGVDSSFRVTFPEDGRYRLGIRDHLSRGASHYAYRIEVSPVTPSVELFFSQNDHALVSIPQGNRSAALISVRRNDVGGPVRLQFSNLPEGVTADSPTIPDGVDTVPVVFQCEEGASLSHGLVNIQGVIDAEGSQISGSFNQKIVLVYGNNQTEFLWRVAENAAVAVTEPAPFSIRTVEPMVPLVRNGNMRLHVLVTRAEGFADPIELRIPWTPSGVGAGTATIPGEATETEIHIEANSSASLGDWRLAVIGTAAERTVSSPLFGLEISEPWVTFDLAGVETEQGKNVELPVTVTRKIPFDGQFAASLLGLPKGVTAEEILLSPNEHDIRFQLHVASEAPAGKTEGLFVQTVIAATGEEILHRWGSGQLTVYEPLPPELQPTPTPVPEQGEEQKPKRKSRFTS